MKAFGHAQSPENNNQLIHCHAPLQLEGRWTGIGRMVGTFLQLKRLCLDRVQSTLQTSYDRLEFWGTTLMRWRKLQSTEKNPNHVPKYPIINDVIMADVMIGNNIIEQICNNGVIMTIIVNKL